MPELEIDDETNKALVEEAKRRGISVSELLAEAVRAYVSEKKGSAPESQ